MASKVYVGARWTGDATEIPPRRRVEHGELVEADAIGEGQATEDVRWQPVYESASKKDSD